MSETRIIWLEEAVQDLDRLRRFLEPDSPGAAQRAAKAIISGIAVLRRHPQAGKPMEDERRELVLPFGAGAYVVRYRVDGNDFVIIRIYHSREAR